jgi:hypothetical protein
MANPTHRLRFSLLHITWDELISLWKASSFHFSSATLIKQW